MPTMPPGVHPVVTQFPTNTQEEAMRDLASRDIIKTNLAVKGAVTVGCIAVAVTTAGAMPGWHCGALVGTGFLALNSRINDEMAQKQLLAATIAGAACASFSGIIGGAVCSYTFNIVTSEEFASFLIRNQQALSNIPATSGLGNAIAWAGVGV